MFPGTILWKIWKARNLTKFNNEPLNAEKDIQLLASSFKLCLVRGKKSTECIQYFNIESKEASESMVLV